MCAASYSTRHEREDDQKPETRGRRSRSNSTGSLTDSDEDDFSRDSSVNEKESRAGGQKASEYLKETLGDTLTLLLTEVAVKRPEDPIAYLADSLARESERKKENVSGKAEVQPESPGKKKKKKKKRRTPHNNGYQSSTDSILSSPPHPGALSHGKLVESTTGVTDSTSGGTESASGGTKTASSSSHGGKEAESRGRSKSRQSRIPTRQHQSQPDLASYEGFSSAPSVSSKRTVESNTSSNWSYNSYSSNNTTRRTQSLKTIRHDVLEDDIRDGEVEKEASKRPRKKKKKTPTVAMTAEEYKKRRGIVQVKKSDEGEVRVKVEGRGSGNSTNSILTSDFDLDKHYNKSKKILNHRAVKPI